MQLNKTKDGNDERLTCENHLDVFSGKLKASWANQDDEVWMEMYSYRDRKHADEVQAKIENDENMKPILWTIGDLMTTHSEGIIGDF